MKLILSLLVFSCVHAQASEQICWEAEGQVTAQLPKVICFDDVYRDQAAPGVLTIDTDLKQNWLSESPTLVDSDNQLYQAVAQWSEDYETCGAAHRSLFNLTVQKRGETADDEYWAVEQLEANYWITNDSCHSRPRVGTIKYKLAQ